ncbi:MAG: hypothetical protein IJC59_05425 [Lachnospiraceae bacterium]|nr:hypothetical protein [Lachnospiraceae bacterium]
MNKKKVVWLCILPVLFIAAVILSFGRLGMAAEETEREETDPTLSFAEFSARNTVEDGVLFIGAHLIHIQGMTDELYETALSSASDRNQTNVYYKSELAQGAWLDITDAGGLPQISGEGKPVTEEEMKDLRVEYYTFSDGITKNALTGAKVNIFNIEEPYDLYNLKELEQLKQQYDELFDEEDSGVNRYYYVVLRDFFSTELRNEVTNECDGQLNGLQAAYEQMQAGGEKELAEIILRLMRKVDARRRAEVLYMLGQAEENLLNELQKLCTGSDYDKEKYEIAVKELQEVEVDDGEGGTKTETVEVIVDYETEQFVENSSVLEAIATAMKECQSGYTSAVSNRLEPGSTVLGTVEYEKCVLIINQNGQGVQEYVRELERIYHIQDGIIADEAAELALIESQLIPRADEKYVQKLTSGTGEEYKVAVANSVSQAAQNQALEIQKTDLNAALQELEFLIREQVKRQIPDMGLTVIYDRIDHTLQLKNVIPADAFARKAEESLEEYRIWLQDLARSVMQENDELASQMDQLEQSREEKMTEYQQALDDNDLALAKKTEAELEVLDTKIKEKEQELKSIIDSENSSPSEKAKAANEAGSATALNQINELEKEALLGLAQGKEDLSDTMSSLALMGAEKALENIRKEAEKSGNSKLAAAADKAIEESKESPLHELYGEGSKSSPQEDSVVRIMEDFFGDSFEQLNPRKQAEALVVLDWLVEDGYRSLDTLFKEYFALAEDNYCIYTKPDREEKEYVALLSVAGVGGYRYIYDNLGQEVTLSKRGAIYRMKAGEDTLWMYPDQTQELAARILWKKDLYIPEEDALLLFGCQGEYLELKNSGICLTETMQKEAEELYSQMEGGEE